MEEIPCVKNEEETLNNFPISLEFNKNKYQLKINNQDNLITFELVDITQIPCIYYIRIMNFKEIQELNELFSLLHTYNDFYDYLLSLSKNKKIKINKNKDKISIILAIDVFSKKQEIKIDLFPEKKYFELRMEAKIKEIEDLKKSKIKEIEDLKRQIKEYSNKNLNLNTQNKELNIKLENKIKEITKIKNEKQDEKLEKLNETIKKYYKENNDLKKQNKELTFSLDMHFVCITITLIILLFLLIYYYVISRILQTDKNELNVELKELYKKFEKYNEMFINNAIKEFIDSKQSVIMTNYEDKIIFGEIQLKMNKPIKSIKKLYQATIDGGDPINFHKKCDNIPNTLVIIKSEGNRNFGGFTPIPWKSEGGGKKDSENKTFVFSLDNKKTYFLKDEYYAAVYHDEKYGPCFGDLDDISIDGNPIKEKCLVILRFNFNYNGDYRNPLSEYEYPNKIKALEYEVFQIIFYD